MRIVYLHQYFKTPNSSGGTRSYEMARRIAAKGHEVHVVTSTDDIKGESSEVIENFTVHWLPVAYSQSMSNNARIKAFALFALRSSFVARKLKGDVVFATSTPLTIVIPGILATLFRKAPLVFEVRDLWPDVPIALGALKGRTSKAVAKIMEKAAYRYSKHIVALSPDMKSGVVAKGISEEKVTIIPNASDNDLFTTSAKLGLEFRRQLPWLGAGKLVVYCGTLGKVNDVSYVARLASEMKKIDDSVRFLIVGNGNDEDNVRETAVDLNVFEENFFMMPPVTKLEVPAVLSAADFSLSTVAPVPALYANSANKVFDTFASGTPLAINHGGWLADLLEENEAGLVLDGIDIKSAANLLLEVLGDSEKLKLLAANSKKLATDKFDRQALAEELVKVLEKAESK
ncbi:glycosyltransferase [Corynebacterium glutamicum Z188]|uniref:Glycosyltransferase WbuB n=2 Tax=Corynebacterium glutamicum TaxID=1718 RepID=A0AB36IAE5_CORGT|nr:glycosyltransferase family 4 protein [Corynebacterium glutamicum]AGN21048.1 glycosyltransferase [Corynebacterium glutamicum SCgG2]EGV40951.1 group 1 glycosyl transferase [Corynebacterium glutamicum S9114]EPP41767.1 glycosyltransferase [Corynebacterium glutamicum Z188]NII88511.1 glycosyltransferase involved in cell wall biosynthesis [Corynebacterium glutamicum]OKX76279.1 glycosyltransferase WbuB [Corynebacterium glutamicum]